MSSSGFAEQVQRIVGPVLLARGFTLDQIDDGLGDGGRELSVVYYRGDDCKIQIYKSSREGETNCMIAPLSAPNEFGLRSATKKWRYLTAFVEHPDRSDADLARMARLEYTSFDDPLLWVQAHIENDYAAARFGILELNRPPDVPEHTQ